VLEKLDDGAAELRDLNDAFGLTGTRRLKTWRSAIDAITPSWRTQRWRDLDRDRLRRVSDAMRAVADREGIVFPGLRLPAELERLLEADEWYRREVADDPGAQAVGGG
jgi:hypothetical protein